MKTLRVGLTIALALLLQTTLARVVARGPVGVDLVLVAVVYLALTMGPVVGIVSGTLGGLIQDAMGSGIIGVGGLAKTLVGFAAGRIGAQFIVTRSVPRLVVFYGASLVEAFVVITLLWALDVRQFGVPMTVIIQRATGNALVGVATFYLVESLPHAVERWRVGRARARTVRLR